MGLKSSNIALTVYYSYIKFVVRCFLPIRSLFAYYKFALVYPQHASLNRNPSVHFELITFVQFTTMVYLIDLQTRCFMCIKPIAVIATRVHLCINSVRFAMHTNCDDVIMLCALSSAPTPRPHQATAGSLQAGEPEVQVAGDAVLP